jgi:hypothetical protein
MTPDHSNPLRNTLVFGQGGFGKTSFGILYLINTPWACAFIFDVSGQIASRLHQKWCSTERECLDALATRFVCYNPNKSFDADNLLGAFQWFCAFSLQMSERGPGRKVLFADDQWEFAAARTMTPELARVVRRGRFSQLEYFGVTHRPQDYHIDVRSLVTEWVAFNTVEENNLACVRDYWPSVDDARTLSKYEFLAYNRESRTQWRRFLPTP